MGFQQPPLPYDMDALKGYISEEQMHYHYNKHHAAYFPRLNDLLHNDPLAESSLDEIVAVSSHAIFNNSAQAWNHTFFWNCMSPSGGGAPRGSLADAIEQGFGGIDQFVLQFSIAATSLFGAGWAWLSSDTSGKLSIQSLSNADTPLKHGLIPVLTLDVWEHAYYVDYRNERPRFVEGFWDVVNWEFSAERYDLAKTGGMS